MSSIYVVDFNKDFSRAGYATARHINQNIYTRVKAF